MTGVRLRTVDAFAERPFTGNPAAILMLDETPPDDWMAAVARETNLSDTGFVIREDVPDADFRLRWFTPTVEIDLCGHATLASAHCLFEDGHDGPIRFATRSGILTLERQAEGSLAIGLPRLAVDRPRSGDGRRCECTRRARGVNISHYQRRVLVGADV